MNSTILLQTGLSPARCNVMANSCKVIFPGQTSVFPKSPLAHIYSLTQRWLFLVMGGPTTEGGCHIKGQFSEELACKNPEDCLLLCSSTGPEPGDSVYPSLWKLRQRISAAHGLLASCTTQIRSKHSVHPQVFLQPSHTVAPPFRQSQVEGRRSWYQVSQ